MNPEALNFERIKKARDHHDATCDKGKADRVYMHPADIERMQWEEGDVIAGLTLYGDSTMSPGRLRISCPGERSHSETADMVPIVDLRKTDKEIVKPLTPVPVEASHGC